MSKRLDENYETWNLHLNQVLAAIRFNVNESTIFSPYYLVYNSWKVNGYPITEC